MIKTILVVDDDREIAEAIKHAVEKRDRNCRCAIASEPYEAALALTEKKFDFVLLDQRLPGGTGTWILEKVDKYIDADPLLTETPAYIQPLPVAIMSGSEAPPSLLDKLHLKHFKMVNFINKRNLSSFLSQTFA